jgi:hypothetical protein
MPVTNTLENNVIFANLLYITDKKTWFSFEKLNQAHLRISWIISKNWALLFLLRRCSCSFWNNGYHVTNITLKYKAWALKSTYIHEYTVSDSSMNKHYNHMYSTPAPY